MRRMPYRRLILFVLATAMASAACTVDNTTVPDTGTTPTGQEVFDSGDLLVIGDWGSGTDDQDRVAEAMADYAADREIAAILTTGDNFYSDDVDDLMEPFGWATDDDIPFLISWGNHDIESGTRIELMNEVFDDPPLWVRHEWGPVDIVILDSSQIDSAPQLRFLDRALESDEDPTIIAFHHPPYTCGKHRESEEVIKNWIPRFDEDVFLVLNGHDHNYQRFEKSDVTYVVTGGGGRHLYELRDCDSDSPDLITGEVTYHFLVLHQDEGVSVTALDADGDVIDEFSIDFP